MPMGLDKLINSLANYIQDAAPEVRESARECFLALGRDLDRVLSKYLPESIYKNVKDQLEKDSKRKSFNRSAEPIRTSSISSVKKRTISSKRSSSNRLRISQNLENDISYINSINTDLHSEDWKIRFGALEKIHGGIIEELNSEQSSMKLLSLIDCLCRTITDQNSKVSHHSLTSLQDLIPKMQSSIEPHLGLLITSLVVTLGSSNPGIRDCTNKICEDIVFMCDSSVAIGPFTSAINVANPRARALLVSLISKIIEDVYKKKPNLITKFAIPLIYKIIDDPHVEVKEEAKKFAIIMYNILGEGLLKNASEAKSSKIKEIIRKSV